MDKLPVGDFVVQLNQEQKLGLTNIDTEAATKVLADQWFNYAGGE